ncbi:MAG: pseudouridine synthase [Paraglaciecola sp.]|nr:pseudouridine synthase [Paraglaciecola sp.]
MKQGILAASIQTYPIFNLSLSSKMMAIAVSSSKLSLPEHNPGVSTVLGFLILKFPAISSDVWQQRMANGKVHWHDGELINAQTPFKAQQRVYYYREVNVEPVVPFSERIVFQDDLILVAYKPHFLPVMPGGAYVEECLQNRLRRKTANPHLQAVHRIDKATAGLVLFTHQVETRQHYHRLFETQQITKTYQAIANIGNNAISNDQTWEVKARMEKSQPKFLMQIVEGVANSHSHIRCVQQTTEQALFELKPISGKTHQLRLHMQSIGFPLLHDTYYPALHTSRLDDYSKPLQLLAQQLRFVDPITQQVRHFSSNTELKLNA